MPVIKDNFCILKVLEATPLQLTAVRSYMNQQDFDYREIENMFIISMNIEYKALTKYLNSNTIKYIIVFVDQKQGCDVKVKGLTDSDKKGIEGIVLDN